MKKLYTILSLSTAILLASCGSEDKKAVADNSPAIPVKVAQVSDNNDSPFLAVSGKIQAANSADLGTRIMGYVDKVHVNVSDKVTKGQLLVSINNADLKAKKGQINAAISKANAAFINAKKNYKRFQNLYKSNSVSQKEMDDMTVNYQMAKATLEAANQMKKEVNAQFVYSNITAPFSGIITSKKIEAGDMANPGMPLVSVEGPGNFEVTASVPESEISKIKSGTAVQVIVKSFDKTLPGTVTEVSTSAKNTGGQYLVKVVLDKTEVDILSGMYATVQFPIEKKTDVSMVLVPQQAIVKRGQLTGIYTVSQSNTAMLRWLRLGRTFGDNVEVLSGLAADENYIVSAEGKLYNGANITIKQ